MHQIALFDELPPGCKVRARRRPCSKGFYQPIGEQLSFTLTIRTEFVDEDDDPWIHKPIIQRTVSATEAAPVTVKGPASVWDMAFTPIAIKTTQVVGKRKILKVERTDGITRCVHIIESETQEYKEREIARRAKQKPPKPTNGYKTMSTKFKALVS